MTWAIEYQDRQGNYELRSLKLNILRYDTNLTQHLFCTRSGYDVDDIQEHMIYLPNCVRDSPI